MAQGVGNPLPDAPQPPAIEAAAMRSERVCEASVSLRSCRCIAVRQQRVQYMPSPHLRALPQRRDRVEDCVPCPPFDPVSDRVKHEARCPPLPRANAYVAPGSRISAPLPQVDGDADRPAFAILGDRRVANAYMPAATHALRTGSLGGRRQARHRARSAAVAATATGPIPPGDAPIAKRQDR